MKTYYKLTTEFHDTGNPTARIDTVEMDCAKPKSTCEETKTKDVYVEYFNTHSEAMETLNASGEEFLFI